MFNKYDKEIKKIISENHDRMDWVKVCEIHARMIARIQHERLIHLLVTIFVGNVMVLCFLATIITRFGQLIYLDIPLLILFSAYLLHYRFLENTTQNWYIFEDKIRKNVKK